MFQSVHRRSVVLGALAVAFTASAPGQVIHEDLKLLASDGGTNDLFGWSVAIDTDVVAIGARQDDEKGIDAGAGYLFDAITGAEMMKLLAVDGEEGDQFGWSIAIDAGVVAVGAAQDDDKGFRAGSAYLFDADSGTQLHKLLGNDSKAEDKFGYCIAISNGIVAVGAPYDTGDEPGRAYLFDASSGAQLHKLVPDDGEDGDQFGISIGIDDGVVAVGAYLSNDNGSDSGSVYLFDSSTGAQIDKLLPDDGDAGDYFGWSVAIDNGIVAVGARTDDDNGKDSGSVYLFDASTGEQINKLLPDDGDSGFQFGGAVDMDGGILAVGMSLSNDNGQYSGSAYLFDVSNGAQVFKMLPSDGVANDLFAHSIAISNGTVAAGAVNDDDNATNAGSTYLFDAGGGDDCLGLAVTNLVAGQQATWAVTDATPGQRVAVVYGFQNGTTKVNGYGGYCAQFGIAGVSANRVIGQTSADANGDATLIRPILNGTSGVRVLFQAAERGTCPGECVSKLLDEIIG